MKDWTEKYNTSRVTVTSPLQDRWLIIFSQPKHGSSLRHPNENRGQKHLVLGIYMVWIDNTVPFYSICHSVTFCDVWLVIRICRFGQWCMTSQIFCCRAKFLDLDQTAVFELKISFFICSVTYFPSHSSVILYDAWVGSVTYVTFHRFRKGCDVWPTNWMKWYSSLERHLRNKNIL